jgi:glutamyl-tRNA(Gln) amidotransferase subunit D
MHASRRDEFKVIKDKIIVRVNYKINKIEIVKELEKPEGKFTVKPNFEEKVALLKVHINMFPEQFKFFKGYKGLVIEGTGLGHTPGHVPNDLAKIHARIFPAIKEVVDSGCIVVMTTQTLFGRVQMHVYDKGTDLVELGIIPGEDMLAETALVKLSWLLANNKKEVKELIPINLRGEINKRIEPDEFL